MVRSAVARVVKRAFKQSRGLHSRPLAHESSIAALLDQGPKDSGKVIVNGFIRSIRNQKHRSFASIGDGSSLEPLQALLTPQQSQRSELPPPLRIPSNSNQTAWQALQWHSCTAHGLMATVPEPQGAKPRASCGGGGCYRILRPCRM
jgi:asparaginyl-tRNA synthetase